MQVSDHERKRSSRYSKHKIYMQMWRVVLRCVGLDWGFLIELRRHNCRSRAWSWYQKPGSFKMTSWVSQTRMLTQEAQPRRGHVRQCRNVVLFWSNGCCQWKRSLCRHSLMAKSYGKPYVSRYNSLEPFVSQGCFMTSIKNKWFGCCLFKLKIESSRHCASQSPLMSILVLNLWCIHVQDNKRIEDNSNCDLVCSHLVSRLKTWTSTYKLMTFGPRPL